MKRQFHLTQAGQQALKDELNSLIGERGNIAERIKTARQLGDLSENAEYQTARADQDRLETRISELEHIIQNSELIKKPKAGNKVLLGSVVKLKNNGKTKEFQVVGTIEADPLNGKVSDESPIGKALMDKGVGDKVELNGTTYKIDSIS